MHADEAVHADKLGTLLEGGGYAYDPTEYHGPTLYYLTLPAAWLRGQAQYADLDEVTLRGVPAVMGVALVAAHLAARSFLGAWPTALAALLAALSPAMVFYSRYYIHETLLVCFSFLFLYAAGRYLRRPAPGWAMLSGVAAGLMQATKETAPIALGCAVLAVAATRLAEGRSRGETRRVRPRDAALALAAGVAVAGLLFTSFLSRPAGALDALRTYGTWLERARTASWHVHPWHYYLGLLVRAPAEGTPLWSEAVVLLLAAAIVAAGWSGRGVPGADRGALRFIAFYALSMLVVYSAIPYKTPWCLLGFHHGLILLAGAGAAWLARGPATVFGRLLVAAALAAALAQLGWQARAGSVRFAADPRNPYVYAHTLPDVFAVARRLEELAASHPAGRAMPIQIVSRENLWPLPWYLRDLPGVRWWNAVSDDAPAAPVVVITAEVQPDLVRRLYEVPPPGERELYVPIFDGPVSLRPGLPLRGYASRGLWERFRRRTAPAGTPP